MTVLPDTPTEASPTTAPRTARDRLLDAIRAVAVVRVVLWHTWSWPWLSWVPAMPAMFFGSGALLGRSIDTYGWATTVGRRLRRLLIPYWVYAAASVTAMVATGWRPDLGDLLPWAIPLTDPMGPADMAGLWIPLWYVRAYLWFVLGGGILNVIARRLGAWSIAATATIAVGVWWANRRGVDIPFAVGDFTTYAPFVLAGMLYTSGKDLAHRTVLASGAIASAVAALWTWQRFGPDDGIVNRSYLLTMLVGTAGLCAVLALRGPALRLATRLDRPIAAVNRRALTIYLWQGFGLVAANRLINTHIDSLAPRAMLALAVVTAVIVTAVIVIGPLEDLAARRRGPRRTKRPGSHTLTRRTACALPGLILLVPALATTPEADVPMPLSGQAVVAAAGGIAESLADPDAPRSGWSPSASADMPAKVVEEWATANTEVLDRLGTSSIRVAVTRPDGRTEELLWSRAPDGTGRATAVDTPSGEPFRLMSLTKTMTAAWFAQLVEQGVVGLDETASEQAPEVRHADEITLDQLARHTSGIPTSHDPRGRDSNPKHDLAALEDLDALASPPGTRFQYSRTGYFLLALALERASGITWQNAMETLAAEADVPIGFDDDTADPALAPTDPDGHGYRGRVWAAGALLTTPSDLSILMHRLFTDVLSASEVDAMTAFTTDRELGHYGLGLMPLCPCEADGERLRSDRFGLDSATAGFAFDRSTGATVVLQPDEWYGDFGPEPEFLELEQALLDHLASA